MNTSDENMVVLAIRQKLNEIELERDAKKLEASMRIDRAFDHRIKSLETALSEFTSSNNEGNESISDSFGKFFTDNNKRVRLEDRIINKFREKKSVLPGRKLAAELWSEFPNENSSYDLFKVQISSLLSKLKSDGKINKYGTAKKDYLWGLPEFFEIYGGSVRDEYKYVPDIGNADVSGQKMLLMNVFESQVTPLNQLPLEHDNVEGREDNF